MSTNGKPKFAMYWGASCGGCEIAVLNTHEQILDIDANFEVVFWPVAMDAKYKDVEAMEDNSILITLFNGGIRNAENEHIARLLRRKSKILVAFGSCAHEGCIPGLANLYSKEELFKTVYGEREGCSTENPNYTLPQTEWDSPQGKVTIPQFYSYLRPLNQVVDVDYYVPGCPPESKQISSIIDLLIQVVKGNASLPPKGSIIGAGSSTVCDECPRKRNEKTIKKFHRIQDFAADPDLCLLEQGIICNGPATRSGCGALCPSAGAACIGCYGEAEGVIDYGARI
jgi:F420-non-reducing hydrogenase small subunit